RVLRIRAGGVEQEIRNAAPRRVERVEDRQADSAKAREPVEQQDVVPRRRAESPEITGIPEDPERPEPREDCGLFLSEHCEALVRPALARSGRPGSWRTARRRLR